ncbi:MAG: hypothetical protein RMM06_02410, partial [Armatimonadota bacterium]|nr:hypothetical protein [Armatimonadota bacterium]
MLLVEGEAPAEPLSCGAGAEALRQEERLSPTVKTVGYRGEKLANATHPHRRIFAAIIAPDFSWGTCFSLAKIAES